MEAHVLQHEVPGTARGGLAPLVRAHLGPPFEQLHEAAGGHERLAHREPDTRSGGEALLEEADVLGEGAEVTDSDLARNHLMHAHAEDEHVAQLGEQ